MTAQPPSWINYGTKAAVAVTIVGTLCMIVALVAFLWPYNDLSITHVGGLQVDERTEDGLPVIRAGEPVEYIVDVCNSGHDVQVVRWLDAYGSYSGESVISEIPNDLNRRAASFLIRQATFYPPDIGCIDDVSVAVLLPADTPTKTFYRLRTRNSYKPNILARTITIETVSEVFYYAGPEDKLTSLE